MAACPVCGAANASTARFCSTCGTALTAAPVGRETRKTVTVLFADVTGSTALGEQLDPETLRTLMGRYFGEMKVIIENHGGTVEKFIGDAVMAVFGIPVVHEDDALRAVRAAADIRDRLAALNEELTASRGLAIRFRTGVNTGEVVAGDPATGQTLVTGDTVNTAARLEQAAPPGEILLGRLTHSLVRDAVKVEPVEPIAAKGKAEPLAAHRLVAVRSGVAGHARRHDAPLVGRERELGRLEQAFAQAIADRSCQLFTLLGTAGVGKSRLVTEFTTSVEPGARVLRGRCLSYGEGITYWPIGEIVRSAAGIDETDTAGPARAKIRALLEGEREADVLAARVAAAVGLSGEPAPQEELFWAIRKLLERLARDRPLVVVVEDVHWAEPTLLDLLEHIADWSRDAPLLLLCPARPEFLDSRPGWGGGKLNATTLLLEPLGAAAAGQLIAALPGGTVIPGATVERIQTAAEGNPLYVEEFLGILVDDDLLKQLPDGTWQAAETIGDVGVPPTISALLAARLERLAPAERAAAERASVVGRIFEQAAVAELTDEALRHDVGHSLLALVRKELVRPDRSELTAGDAFKFRHILIRDAAYEALPKAERADLHERFADWLERTAGDRLAELEEIVGYHLARANHYRIELGETGTQVEQLAERAAERLATAGERARERGDVKTATPLLSQARSLAVSSPLRDRASVGLAACLFTVGRSEESRAIISTVVNAAPREGGDALRWNARLLQMELELVADNRVATNAVEEAHKAIAGLVAAKDSAGVVRGYRLLSMYSTHRGDERQSLKDLQEGLAYAASFGTVDQERWIIGNLALSALMGPTPVAEATAIAQRGIELGRRATEAMTVLGALEAESGNRRSADERWAQAKQILVETGHLWGLAGHYLVVAMVTARTGDLSRARADAELGYGLLLDTDERSARATFGCLLASVLAQSGSVELADGILLAVRDEVTNAESRDTSDLALLAIADAYALIAHGTQEAAVATAASAVARSGETERFDLQGDAHLVLARATRGYGDPETALGEYRAAEAAYLHKGNTVAATLARREGRSASARPAGPEKSIRSNGVSEGPEDDTEANQW